MTSIPFSDEFIDNKILIAKSKLEAVEKLALSNPLDENLLRQSSILRLRIESLNNLKGSYKSVLDKVNRGTKSFYFPQYHAPK
jgi:hypothetical protein